MVTRDDVARAAGVSSAVVSYVLNDGPRPVSAAARQRVLEAISTLGYRRNSIARSMRTRTTHTLGLVLPEITLAYFSTMTQRVTDAARTRGLSVIVATSGGSAEVEREHVSDLADRQVDGIILMSVDPEQDFGWVEALGTPILLVDRPVAAVEATAAAVEHLVEVGAQYIARLAGPRGALITRRRDEGWDHAAVTHADHLGAVVHAGPSPADGYEAALSLLRGAPRPDAVVIDAPNHAPGVLRAAADLGVVIPDDLAVVALEVGAAGEYTVPRLSSVDSPVSDIAERSVDAIATVDPTTRLFSLDGTEFTLTARESSALVRQATRITGRGQNA